MRFESRRSWIQNPSFATKLALTPTPSDGDLIGPRTYTTDALLRDQRSHRSVPPPWLGRARAVSGANQQRRGRRPTRSYRPVSLTELDIEYWRCPAASCTRRSMPKCLPGGRIGWTRHGRTCRVEEQRIRRGRHPRGVLADRALSARRLLREAAACGARTPHMRISIRTQQSLFVHRCDAPVWRTTSSHIEMMRAR